MSGLKGKKAATPQVGTIKAVNEDGTFTVAFVLGGSQKKVAASVVRAGDHSETHYARARPQRLVVLEDSPRNSRGRFQSDSDDR